MKYLIPDGSSMKALPDCFGIIRSPHAFGVSAGIKEGRSWAADNAAFTKGFEPDRFFPFLDSLLPYVGTCLFVVLPDVVGDSKATAELYAEFITKYRSYPFPVAFVAQDGISPADLPQDYDVLFIGGSTEFKLSRTAVACIREAKKQGKRIHIGRVNTYKRLVWSWRAGADSVDGTCLAFGRDINLARLKDWMERIDGYHKHQTSTPGVFVRECFAAGNGDTEPSAPRISTG